MLLSKRTDKVTKATMLDDLQESQFIDDHFDSQTVGTNMKNIIKRTLDWKGHSVRGHKRLVKVSKSLHETRLTEEVLPNVNYPGRYLYPWPKRILDLQLKKQNEI